jgi:hypothetical protein
LDQLRHPSLAGSSFGVSQSAKKQLRPAREATARYRSVAKAEADGYQTAPGPGGKQVCVSSPVGGMGIHYENAALMATAGSISGVPRFSCTPRTYL